MMKGFLLNAVLLLGIFSQASAAGYKEEKLTQEEIMAKTEELLGYAPADAEAESTAGGRVSVGMGPFPSCPPYFVVPLPCRLQGLDYGFCYNPSTVSPNGDFLRQGNSFECLSGVSMGDGGPTGYVPSCPTDKPKMCQFTGTDHGFYNDIMYVGFFLFPCTMCYVFYHKLGDSKKKATDGYDFTKGSLLY